MAQTLVSLIVHVVFSTKQRRALITPAVEPELYAYLGGTAKNLGSRCLAIGGTENHVHLLISQSKNMALSHLMGRSQEELFKMDQNQEFAIPNLRLAGWVWSLHRRPIHRRGAEAIHCQTKGTP